MYSENTHTRAHTHSEQNDTQRDTHEHTHLYIYILNLRYVNLYPLLLLLKHQRPLSKPFNLHISQQITFSYIYFMLLKKSNEFSNAFDDFLSQHYNHVRECFVRALTIFLLFSKTSSIPLSEFLHFFSRTLITPFFQVLSNGYW